MFRKSLASECASQHPDRTKSGFGWSDEELYENYCYNLQVRYALGYDRLIFFFHGVCQVPSIKILR